MSERTTPLVKKEGVAVGRGRTFDFHEGSNVDITVTETDQEVDITISASGVGGGGGHTIAEEGTPVSDRATLNFGAGFDVTDDAGNDETDITLDLSEVAAGGELAGTMDAPTVDATHAGSTHSAATDTHIADGTGAHAASAISIADAGNDFTATDVEGALDELQADNEAHVAAADPHTGYVLESLFDAKGDLIAASADNTPAKLTVGSNGQMLTAQSGQSAGLQWATHHTSVPFTKTGTISTGTGATRWYNDSGRTLTFVEVRAAVGTAPAGAAILCDVNVDATTIWSTQGNRVTIADGANTGSSTTFNTTTIADGSFLTVDIDQVGSGTAGADLVVTVWMSG